MIFRDLSRRDAIFLLELINNGVFCTNENTVRSLVDRLKTIIPFDHAVCGIAQLDSNKNLKSYEIINISYPSKWLDLYIRKDFHKIDPIVEEHFRQPRLQYWADTYAKYKLRKEFIDCASEFGLTKGYTFGLKSLNGNQITLVSLAGKSFERSTRNENILITLTPHVHEALTRTASLHHQSDNLTSREKEVLNWLKDGKSSWDISVILSISERTVNFHVNNIMMKLDAVSRTHAVAIAVRKGLVNID